MIHLKIIFTIVLLGTPAITSANGLGLSDAQLNSLLNPQAEQPKQVVKPQTPQPPAKVASSVKVDKKPKKIEMAKVQSVSKSKRVSCKSFNTQPEAQRHYDLRFKSWKALDRDKDGEPCECLKGGSRYGESICERWRKKARKK